MMIVDLESDFRRKTDTGHGLVVDEIASDKLSIVEEMEHSGFPLQRLGSEQMRQHEQENREGKLLHLDLQDCSPAVRIGGFTVLNRSQGVVQFQTDRAWFAVFREYIAFAGIGIVHAPNRSDHRCRSASAYFFEIFEFFQEDGATFHRHTHILGQLNKALVGDGGQNGG